LTGFFKYYLRIVLQHVVEGNVEMKRRRGKVGEQLLDVRKEGEYTGN